MNRADLWSRLESEPTGFDVLIIGGGATGLGAGLDAVSRGYRTVVVEAHDFAAGTSSRSTKLIHGGVRYLAQSRLHLVRESLRERGLLLQNAPELVHSLPFVLPCYRFGERFYYGIGLKIYDLLAGSLGIGRTRLLSAAETQELLPTVKSTGLRGGVCYHDGQFDDARLAIALARTINQRGGLALNYVQAIGLRKAAGKIVGADVVDAETGRSLAIGAKIVINATGVFTESVQRLDADPPILPVRPSRGAHLVLDRSFFPGGAGLLVPKTDDGRVLFIIPWLDHVIVGTTDVPAAEPTWAPTPTVAEIDYLLEHAGRRLSRQPERRDIRAVYAGLRPLIGSAQQATAKISREHGMSVSAAGLLSITGGKWTTYRQMGQDVIDRAAQVAGLPSKPSTTHQLPLLTGAQTSSSDRLHPRLPYTAADIDRAIADEYARTVEDILARRLRATFLDIAASLELAPLVAARLACKLGHDADWERTQLEVFRRSAQQWTPPR